MLVADQVLYLVEQSRVEQMRAADIKRQGCAVRGGLGAIFNRSAQFNEPLRCNASASSPQRRAATSRVRAGVPSSLLTHRTSVLVTTQTKVSWDVGGHSGASRKRIRASSGRR